MAETTRGYPIFSGGMAPAGPVQMQQLAEAIDADVTTAKADALAATAAVSARVATLEVPTRVPLTTSNTGLYGPRGGGYQTPSVLRDGKHRTLQGSFTNIVTINFSANVEYPLLTLASADRPTSAMVYPVWVAQGTGYVTVKSDGTVAMVLSAGSYGGGAWAIDLSVISWYVP